MKCSEVMEVVDGFKVVIYFTHSDTREQLWASPKGSKNNPFSWLVFLIGISCKIPTLYTLALSECKYRNGKAHHLLGGRCKLHTVASAYKANKLHCHWGRCILPYEYLTPEKGFLVYGLDMLCTLHISPHFHKLRWVKNFPKEPQKKLGMLCRTT